MSYSNVLLTTLMCNVTEVQPVPPGVTIEQAALFSLDGVAGNPGPSRVVEMSDTLEVSVVVKGMASLETEYFTKPVFKVCT